MPPVDATVRFQGALLAINAERRAGRVLIQQDCELTSKSTRQVLSPAPSHSNGLTPMRLVNALFVRSYYIAALAMPVLHAAPC